jgi:hypothetical protein
MNRRERRLTKPVSLPKNLPELLEVFQTHASFSENSEVAHALDLSILTLNVKENQLVPCCAARPHSSWSRQLRPFDF